MLSVWVDPHPPSIACVLRVRVHRLGVGGLVGLDARLHGLLDLRQVVHGLGVDRDETLHKGKEVGVYKIWFHFAAFMWESIICLLPPPICIVRTIAILLHVYCARYDAPPTPPLYAIHRTMLEITISCKG